MCGSELSPLALTLLAAAMALGGCAPSERGHGSTQLRATISVNAAEVITTFKPLHIFGNLTPNWIDTRHFVATQSKFEAAGNRFLIYSGGSAQDDFHWNGNGRPDPVSGLWTCSDTDYSPSVFANATYRGSTNSWEPPSHLSDGDLSTSWKSSVNTDFPNHQWVYVDLGSLRQADSVTIDWSTPRAAKFTIQYWNPAAENQGAPYRDESESNWLDTTAIDVQGSDGKQSVAFARVRSQYFRVLMTESSGGPGAAYAIAELSVYEGDTLLTRNTDSLEAQSSTTSSSMDPASDTPRPASFDFESFMAYVNTFDPPALPLITVNFSTGSPEEAAAWVHYANVVRGYAIKYWEIGNEQDGQWETGGPLNAKDYARRYIEFYEAMKAEDPSIVIAGPCSTAQASSNNGDGKSFIQGFVDRLASDPAGNKAHYAEAIDFHWFPTAGQTPQEILASPAQWGQFARDLRGWLGAHPNPDTVPVLMTSYNSLTGSQSFSNRLENGLWLSNWLGEFIRYFGSRGSSHLWASLNGGDAVDSVLGGDLAYLQVEENAYQYQERAHYWAMQLMATRWAIAGDPAEHSLVRAVTSREQLVAYANRRPDGILSLLVVNKDFINAYDTTIISSSFSPARIATRWTFDATNYRWDTSSLPYHAEPSDAPTSGMQTGVADAFDYRFPPYSITVFQFSPK